MVALTPGARVGSYEIAALIGVGGMGEVYRATDTKLKRRVAIKVLPDAVASDAERLARFQREAEVLASLNHPNIAAIYGLEEADGSKALVMELVEGVTLADRISEGPIPLDEALAIAKQIAEALEAAHEQGIVHRDLKPANVKVRSDGAVKVLDFGLAKAMAQAPGSPSSQSMAPTITTPAMTQAGVILGTARYMSPEQARGRPLDKRTDIWAFGAVLYEMLTGRPSFRGDDVTETVAVVLKTEPDQLSYRHGVVGGARFTSDGQEIVFAAALDDQPYRIFRTNRTSFQPRLMTDVPAADLLAVSSGNLLALSMERLPASGWWPLGRLAEKNLYGGAPRPVDNGSVISYDYGPNGDDAVVHRVGNESVLEFPVGTVVHRAPHIGRVRISPDGSRVCFTEFYFRLMIAEAGSPAELLLGDISRASSCAWSPNGAEVLFNTSPGLSLHTNIGAVRPDGEGRRVLGAFTSYAVIQDVAADGGILISAGTMRYSALGARSTDPRARNLSVFDASRAVSLNGRGTHLLVFDNSQGAGPNGLFIRPMDGGDYQTVSSATASLALSNDATVVAVRGDGVTSPAAPDMITLIDVDTGARRSVQLDFDLGALGNILGMNVWGDQVAEFSDAGRRLLLPYARKDGEMYRAYVWDFEEQRSYAVTPEGVTGPVILSPDGRHVASNEADGLRVYEVETGDFREVPGGPDPGLLARWSLDDNIVFLIEQSGAGATIVERNLRTGNHRERKEVRAMDEAGITLFDLKLARNGETYAYSENRQLTDLYLLEGYTEPN